MVKMQVMAFLCLFRLQCIIFMYPSIYQAVSLSQLRCFFPCLSAICFPVKCLTNRSSFLGCLFLRKFLIFYIHFCMCFCLLLLLFSPLCHSSVRSSSNHKMHNRICISHMNLEPNSLLDILQIVELLCTSVMIVIFHPYQYLFHIFLFLKLLI